MTLDLLYFLAGHCDPHMYIVDFGAKSGLPLKSPNRTSNAENRALDVARIYLACASTLKICSKREKEHKTEYLNVNMDERCAFLLSSSTGSGI